VLRRLTAQGLLNRVDDPRDRRRVILRLTSSGVRANAVRRGTVERAIATALQGISPRDRASAKRVLERLARHLAPTDGSSLGKHGTPPRGLRILKRRSTSASAH
jgi:DNA-binding MarR family transcriptional regulator